MLTAYDDSEQVLHAFRAGGSAYCPKDITPHKLVQILRQVVQGHYVVGDQVFDQEGLQAWLEHQVEKAGRSHVDEAGETFSPLSPREMEILQHVTRGLSNKEIAAVAGHQPPNGEEPYDCDFAQARRGRPDSGRRLRAPARLGATAELTGSLTYGRSRPHHHQRTGCRHSRGLHERTQQELRELNRMIDQSRGEVEKLAQRNAAIAAHLRQLQGNFENMPRADIRTAYEAAQEAQQRLFTMRGQLEKLQGEQANLERLSGHLQRSLTALQALGRDQAGRAMARR